MLASRERSHILRDMMNIIQQLNKVDRICKLLIYVGIIISSYALYLELKHENDPSYKALCDINKLISCTSILTSNFGKGFGVLPHSLAYRNPVFGLIFYISLFFLLQLPPRKFTCQLLIISTSIANLLTFYLAFILYLMGTICLVCVSSYIVNFLLFIYSIMRYRIVKDIHFVKQD